jgi:pilus assembly protein CpaF
VVRQYIGAGIRLVVHVSRLQGGARKIVRVSEIVGVESGAFHIEDVFGYRQTGVDEEGNAVGEFYATGYRPACTERLRATGAPVPDEWFAPRTWPAPAAADGEVGPAGDAPNSTAQVGP